MNKENNSYTSIMNMLVIFLAVVISIMCIYIHELSKFVKEVRSELDAYRDNYVALWATVNTYHNIDTKE